MKTKALFHLAVRTLGNKKGNVQIKFSPLRAIAYRLGIKLPDPFHKDYVDFSHKQDIQPLYASAIEQYQTISGPKNAQVKMGSEYNDEGLGRSYIAAPSYISPKLFDNLNTEAIWFAAGKRETVKHANFAREIILNIPKDLDEKERSDLLVKVCAHIAETHGVVVEGALHTSKDNLNPHAHIMFSTRRIVNTLGHDCDQSMFSYKTDELDRWASQQFLDRINLPQQQSKEIQKELERFKNRNDLMPEEIKEKEQLNFELKNCLQLADIGNAWQQRKVSNDPQNAPVPLLRKEIRKLVDQSIASKGIKTQEDSGVTYFIKWLTYLTANDIESFKDKRIEDLVKHYCESTNQMNQFDHIKTTFNKLHHKFFLMDKVSQENINSLKNALKNTQISRESAKKITYISEELRHLIKNTQEKINQIKHFYASEVSLAANIPIHTLVDEYKKKLDKYHTAMGHLVYFCKCKYYQINKRLKEINNTLPQSSSFELLASNLFKKPQVTPSPESQVTPSPEPQVNFNDLDVMDFLSEDNIPNKVDPVSTPSFDDIMNILDLTPPQSSNSFIHFINNETPQSPATPVPDIANQSMATPTKNFLAITVNELLQLNNIAYSKYTDPNQLNGLEQSLNEFSSSINKMGKQIQRLIKTMQIDHADTVQSQQSTLSYKRPRNELLNNEEQPREAQQDDTPPNKKRKPEKK